MKRWNILQSKPISTIDEIVELLLSNRSIGKKELVNFLSPNTESITLENVGLDKKEFTKFKKRLQLAIDKNEKIVVFGDYDVDGITASAILWETLNSVTKNATAYIPSRMDEGYGLSIRGIDNVLLSHPDTKLIITVDNGIVANSAVTHANKKGIDVIVTDHHVKGEKLPEAFCILHTTSLCGGGIAWVVARELGFESRTKINEKLELAALATVADLVPLIGANRAIVKEGLEKLQKTKRIGLVELLKQARIDKETLSVYSIGHQIAPRLNASGRLTHAINALRLLCTNNLEKAVKYAKLLNDTNKDRQLLTDEAVQHAKLLALEHKLNSKIMLVSHSSYNQGIIGLVASHLVESYYRPSFAISIGDDGASKGSARSISGVNIVEMLRSVSHILDEVGGHPMAAGFSLQTSRIEELHIALARVAEEVVTDEIAQRVLRVDALLPFEVIDKSLYRNLQSLAPFGMGNPEPVFATEGVTVEECRKIGREGNHLKLKLSKDKKIFDAVGFGIANEFDLQRGDLIDVAYTIDENEWNGKTTLQLKVRDLKAIE